MQKYDYTLEYRPRRELLLPDMLSYASLSETTDNMEEQKMYYTVIWYGQAYQSQNPNLKKNERKQPKMSRWKTLVKSSNVDGQEQMPVSVTVPACIGTWEIKFLNWTVSF